MSFSASDVEGVHLIIGEPLAHHNGNGQANPRGAKLVSGVGRTGFSQTKPQPLDVVILKNLWSLLVKGPSVRPDEGRGSDKPLSPFFRYQISRVTGVQWAMCLNASVSSVLNISMILA